MKLDNGLSDRGAMASYLADLKDEVPLERFQAYLEEIMPLVPPATRRSFGDALAALVEARECLARAQTALAPLPAGERPESKRGARTRRPGTFGQTDGAVPKPSHGLHVHHTRRSA